MNHKRNPYDETGRRIYLVKELKRVFGCHSRFAQLDDHIVVEFESRYMPNNFRFACTAPLHMLHNGKLRNPIFFIPDPFVSKLLDFHFGADTIVETMLGHFDDGRKLFFALDEPRDVWQTTHILIKIRWNSTGYSRDIAFTWFTSAVQHCFITNNDGRRGADYWIIPLDTLRQQSNRDTLMELLEHHFTKIAATYDIPLEHGNAADTGADDALVKNCAVAPTKGVTSSPKLSISDIPVPCISE